MMGGKIVFLLLCCLSQQALCSSLTKKIDLAQKVEQQQSSQQTFQEAAKALGQASIRQEIVKLIFKSPETALANLADLLDRNDNPSVEEVLDAFNSGFDARLLIINEDNMQLNANEFERLLSQSARDLAKTLHPNNYFQQLVTFAAFQKKIFDADQILRPAIEAKKIPVELFQSALSRQEHSISKRAIAELQQKDLITDLIGLAGETVCNTIVTAAYKQLNGTLTNVASFLSGITLSSDDSITSLIAGLLGHVLDLVDQLLTVLDNLAQSLTGSICSVLLSSNSTNSTTARRRRDIDNLVELSQLQADVGLVKTAQTSSLATRDVFSDIWSLVSDLVTSALNTLLKSFSSDAIAALSSAVLTYLNSLIDAAFPTS